VVVDCTGWAKCKMMVCSDSWANVKQW
jgi:hypothetical protein